MLLNEKLSFSAVSEKAYAKLNISLDVTAKRGDGYHEMLMIMQTVSLCDELTITPEEGGVVHATTGLPYVPGDMRNLAVRAALKFLELIGDEGRGMKITIRKNIPVGAGMAGGSADAAAVLRALNRAYGHPLTAEQLLAAGETIGSDVAFCLRGGTMLAGPTSYDGTEWGTMTASRSAIASDAVFQQKMKDAIKYYLYTTAGSNAMNGITSDVELVYVRTWWQNAVTGATVAAGILTALCAIFYIRALSRGRKEQ